MKHTKEETSKQYMNALNLFEISAAHEISFW